MFTANQVYLIYESHGEYDDHIEIPICTVDNYDFALILIEEFDKALKSKEGEFYELIRWFNFRLNDETHRFEIRVLRHVELN
jgi:hypothetical protein